MLLRLLYFVLICALIAALIYFMRDPAVRAFIEPYLHRA
jgi:hypothetical protein